MSDVATGAATSPSSARMLTTLVRLRDALQRATLPLEIPGVDERRVARVEMIDQLEDYVLPRLVQIDAPLLTVVGGSTGAGKSTLVNSLVGTRVTTPGVLRPTTRSPVLVHNPADAGWFGQDRILPDLERTASATTDPNALQLVATTSLPPGLAVLDAPDIDSVEERNRALATQLLAAADLWLFVTTAARYADQVPWDFLKQAADRSAAVAIVLDRTPAAAVAEVSSHLARMLTARGLRDSPLFAVRESIVDNDGLLPASDVAEIKDWLGALAADAGARSRVVKQTLEGAIRSLAAKSHQVADAAMEQVAMQARLLRDVDQAYDDAVRTIDEASRRRHPAARRGAGPLAGVRRHRRAAPRTRVQGELAARPDQQRGQGQAAAGGPGDGRRRVRPADPDPRERRERRRAHAPPPGSRWRQVGSCSTRAAQDLARASRDFRARSDRAVRDWQQGVLDLVRKEGADKRSTARFLAYGVNGLAVALMVVVFASTAGITGAEVGIAGGSAVVGQKLLEAVFGDQAVRRLATAARRDLNQRVQALLDAERRRFVERLDKQEISTTSPEEIREVARAVDDLRFAQRMAEREESAVPHAVAQHRGDNTEGDG